MSTLTELPISQVAASRTQLQQLLQEAYPETDFRGGVLSDLVLELAAVLATHSRTEINITRQAMSLQAINENPELADDDIVTGVLSNFRVERLPGSVATGDVVIVLSQAVPTSIGSNTVFTANGQSFRTEAAYTVRLTEAAVTASTDRLLSPLGDGTFGFTIPVVAVDVGIAGMLKRGTTLAASVPFQQFLTAYAAEDFTDGFDAETNQDLLAKLTAGMATKAWSNRVTIDAMLRAQPDFQRILQTSLIGFGDAEMSRDQRSLFPVSTGGRTDLYVRTQELPQAVSLRKTATFIEATAAGGIWQIELAAAEAPAMYHVAQIVRTSDSESAAGYEVLTDVRGRDMPTPATSDTYLPDIATALEATYSAYQSAVIRFLDTDTSTAELTPLTTTAEYQITVLAMPKILDAQAYFNQRDVRPPQCDVVVRAPVPCFLDLTFTLTKRATTPAPDLDAIKQLLAVTVNRAGFPGQLFASQLSDVVYNLLDEGITVGRIDMHGRLRMPDGDFIRLRDFEVLTIPEHAALFTSGRTVGFLLDPQDVDIAVQASETLEV